MRWTNQIVVTDHTAAHTSPATIEAMNGELAELLSRSLAHGRHCGDGPGRLALWQSIELDSSSSLVCIRLSGVRKLNRSRKSEQKLGDGLI